MRRLIATIAILLPAPVIADVGDYIGKPVVSVRIEIERQEARDDALLQLVETRVGEPLSVENVRETILHLFSLGRFQDVQVNASPVEGGVALTYDLVPLHSVGRVVLAGDLELSEGLLRDAIETRYGPAPSVGRALEAAQTIADIYRSRGFLNPVVTPRPVIEHQTERTTLIFEVTPGARARINGVQIEGSALLPPAQLLDRLDLAAGRPYDPSDLEQRLTRYAETLRARGYYEAVVEHSVQRRPDGATVDVTVEVQPGPRVTIVFQGDTLSEEQRDELVPVRSEGSVDEDLLEDSTIRIVEYLRSQGYWKARTEYRRAEAEGLLQIVFNITRGRQYRIGQVLISGNASVPIADLTTLVPMKPGDLFVEARLTTLAAAITEHYRRLGYPEAKVDIAFSEDESAAAPSAGTPGVVTSRVVITEGPRTVIGAVTFTGNDNTPDADLRASLQSLPGTPFYRPRANQDRERALLHYLNIGYQDAAVDLNVSFSEDRTRADLEFAIREGEQVLVDHILIVGNTRTDATIIQRELRLRAGEPLGLERVVESQQRLRALGLFRGVRITEITHTESNARDVLVSVEEAPATSVGYGGGLEGGKRLRRAQTGDGSAEERLEFAPRGFFEVGRRNLWGKNRSVDLFTRISIRQRNDPDDSQQESSGLGFSEYRVLGTYREPRAFGWNADAVVSGFIEQAIRSSFDFTRRGVHGELARILARGFRVSGRFAFDRTRLFNERFNQEDELLIDRLFPQVRLATIANGIVRDTRADPLDPDNGGLTGVETEIAARSIGSQVGFAKTFVQGFMYRRLPGPRRVILAIGARVGLATGFPREVPRIDAAGQPVLDAQGRQITDPIEEIPASERFFAGGDTTVRGFALDRLGADDTLDQNGFPQGGNALIVLNSELRIPVWRDVGAVAFIDAGNVFSHVTTVGLDEIRSAAGFGLRYKSPIGPIRVDLGFKVGTLREFAAGTSCVVTPQNTCTTQERRTALHISIGHAF